MNNTLKHLLEFSSELEKEKPNKSAYWHLLELRQEIQRLNKQ